MTKTQALVIKLLELGVSKWYLAYKSGLDVSYNTVVNWEKGIYQARKKHLLILIDLYDRKCFELGIGLYAK